MAALPPDWVHELLGNAQPPAVNDRSRLIVCLSLLGRFAEALPHEAELIRLAEAIPHAYARSVSYHGASQLHFIKGDWTKAHALIERQIEALRSANIADELPHALAYSARALAQVGDASGALIRLREGERLLADQTARRRTGIGFIHVALGRACLDLGLPDEASAWPIVRRRRR